MISIVHIFTLLFIIKCIIFCIITGYTSDKTAIIAVVACVLYIIIGAIVLIIQDKPINQDSECIIGSGKKMNGVLENGCIDIWMIYHLIFWILIGLLSPNRWLIIIVLSAVWELSEHIIFKYIIKNCDTRICGRTEDIFLNLLGYGIGTLFRI